MHACTVIHVDERLLKKNIILQHNYYVHGGWEQCMHDQTQYVVDIIIVCSCMIDEPYHRSDRMEIHYIAACCQHGWEHTYHTCSTCICTFQPLWPCCYYSCRLLQLLVHVKEAFIVASWLVIKATYPCKTCVPMQIIRTCVCTCPSMPFMIADVNILLYII